MAVIAVVNASLMAWLWRFPMVPDPTGRDPAGISTAPRLWVNVHRTLGYTFVLIYAAVLFEMVPRIWEFRVFSAVAVVHGILGAVVGVLLVVKISIIRRFHSLGGWLPFIGGTLAVTALVMNIVALVPAWKVVRPFAAVTPELAAGRDVVAAKCFQCHGASTIAGEREDDHRWQQLTQKMQRFSYRIPGKNPISEPERALAAAYLVSVLGERGEDEREDVDDGGGQRRRRRGRDRR